MNDLVTITHEFNGVPIYQRADGYWNAVAMCAACGKTWSHYRQNANTSAYLDELSRSLGIPGGELVQSSTSGANKGTWVHEQVAIHLAQWCNEKFALMVTRWVLELLKHGHVELPQARPVEPRSLPREWGLRITPAIRAHALHLTQNFPAGWWSVVIAAMPDIFMVEDEMLRHCIPIKHHDLFDGSIGTNWGHYRKDKSWAAPGPRFTAPLLLPGWRYSDGQDRISDVNVYGPEERAHFHGWLHAVYLPKKLYPYLTTKYVQPEYQLALASTADNSSRSIAGVRADLPAKILRLIDQSHGCIPVTTAPAIANRDDKRQDPAQVITTSPTPMPMPTVPPLEPYEDPVRGKMCEWYKRVLEEQRQRH